MDDGAYSYAHEDPEVLSAVLSRKYKLLEEWINANLLDINADKTHLRVMGPRHFSPLSAVPQVCKVSINLLTLAGLSTYISADKPATISRCTVKS